MSDEPAAAPEPLTPEERRAAKIRLRELLVEKHARILAKDLRRYARDAWPIVEPATEFIPNWHIDAICDHLTAVSRGEIRNLLITMPPRHMKSLTVCVLWPTWEWTSNPALRFLFASYGEDLAIRDSLKCRRIVESTWYQERWGHRVSIARDQGQKTRFDNAASGYRIATGVGGKATGEGGDRLVVDDAHKIMEAESDQVRKGVLDWWDAEMSTRGNNPNTVAKVVVGQRVHENDLPGHLIELGGWEHLNLPEEYEAGSAKRSTSIGFSDPRTEEGELLWPTRFGPEVIKEAKLMGSYRYSALFQQRPAPAGGGVFKRAWWKFFTAWPTEYDQMIQSWDLAFKDLGTSDYVCGGVLASRGGDFYVLDVIKDQLDFPASCKAIETLSAKWPQAHRKLVEDKANGPALIAQLKHRVPGLTPVEPRGNKDQRASAASPFVESGNVYLPDPSLAPWVEDFIAELAAFPKGANDDQVDMFSQAMDRLAGRRDFDLLKYAAIVREREDEKRAEAERIPSAARPMPPPNTSTVTHWPPPGVTVL